MAPFHNKYEKFTLKPKYKENDKNLCEGPLILQSMAHNTWYVLLRPASKWQLLLMNN